MKFFLDVSHQVRYVAAAVEGRADLVEGCGFGCSVVLSEERGSIRCLTPIAWRGICVADSELVGERIRRRRGVLLAPC